MPIKLYGRLVSPFVRRVAMLLDELAVPFERIEISAVADQERLRAINPIGRVPALEIEDGTLLVDSLLITDWLCDRFDGEGTWLPKTGDARRRVLQLVGAVNGALEKTTAAYYEKTRRPAEAVWEPWIDLCLAQAVGGLDLAERLAAGTGPYAFGDQPTIADLAVASAGSFLPIVGFDPVRLDRFSRLAAIAAEVETRDSARRYTP